MKLCAGALGVIAGLLSVNAKAGVVDLITNGSFETPVVTGTYQQFPTSIPGWTGTAGIEIQANGALGAGQGTAFGNQYAELAVQAPSTYWQTVSTVPGTQYTLSFYLSARPGTGSNSVRIDFTGASSSTFTAADSGKVNLQQFTESLTATAAQSVLSLVPTGLADPGGVDLIDNVSLTTSSDTRVGSSSSAVPVPAAFWTGLTGLGGLSGIGFARQILRRKPSKTVFRN